MPDEAEILLNRLLSIILNTRPQPEVQEPGVTPEVSTYAMGLYTHLQRLEKQLQEVQAARKQALEATQYVAAVRAAANVDDKLDQFLAVLEASRQSQLYKHSANAIAMLQAKIKGTRAAWMAVADDTEYIV